MKYECIGFDIRVWPCDGRFGVGESEWSQAEDSYQEIKKNMGLCENMYGILDISNNKILREVKGYLEKIDKCTLIAIEIPDLIAEANALIYGFPHYKNLDMSGFKVCGIDVADINGLFSVLSHPDIKKYRGGQELIKSNEIEELLNIIQLASILDKKHSPYIATRLLSQR
jgi:hypothetical protein